MPAIEAVAMMLPVAAALHVRGRKLHRLHRRDEVDVEHALKHRGVNVFKLPALGRGKARAGADAYIGKHGVEPAEALRRVIDRGA